MPFTPDGYYPEPDVWTVPELITGREGSEEQHITEDDLYDAQTRWRFVKVYRLTKTTRKELCSMLIKNVDKKAQELKGCDAYEMWQRVVDDPEWPDQVLAPAESDR